MHIIARAWQSLVRLVRGPTPPPPKRNADDDPVVRWLRLEQRKSERRMRHNTPIRSWPESSVWPERKGGTR